MPKVIENIRESLIAQAKKQVKEAGYSALSIRSVAKACGIATGTVYNYFESKEMLVASFMAEDWLATLSEMKARASGKDDPLEVLSAIHDGLQAFISANSALFMDPQAGAAFNAAGKSRHQMLVNQLIEIAGPVCDAHAKTKDASVSEFAVETLLLWAIQGKSFPDYITIISNLFE